MDVLTKENRELKQKNADLMDQIAEQQKKYQETITSLQTSSKKDLEDAV